MSVSIDHKLILRFLIPALLFGVIFYLSSVSGLKSDYAPIIDFILRKNAHIVEYTLLFIAIFYSLEGYNNVHISNEKMVNLLKLTLAITFIVSLSDEYHQFFVPGRESKVFDLMYDSIGYLIGYFVILGVNKLKE